MKLRILHKVFNYIKNLFGNVIFYCIVTFVFFLASFIFFIWKKVSTFSINFPIDHAIWGQFGDFVGGTLGVIFSLISVMLVVWTFKTQNKTAQTQRFNDLFFELLTLHHEQEKLLKYKIISSNGKETIYDYKDFFNIINENLVENFSPTSSISKNRKAAIKAYIDETIDYKNTLSLYYRTIFQVLSLIDESNLESKERKEYIKILRSQLTESELLFLRYHIKSGDFKKFAFLVNKSNLLKHLPLLNLLELKYWRDKLDKVEIREANVFFTMLFKALRENKNKIAALDNSIVVHIYQNKYSIKLKFEKEKDCVWSSKFTSKEFENLCEVILKEIIIFSNYSCYNNYKNLYFIPAKTMNNFVTVEVINKLKEKIYTSYNDVMKIENIDRIF